MKKLAYGLPEEIVVELVEVKTVSSMDGLPTGKTAKRLRYVAVWPTEEVELTLEEVDTLCRLRKSGFSMVGGRGR